MAKSGLDGEVVDICVASQSQDEEFVHAVMAAKVQSVVTMGTAQGTGSPVNTITDLGRKRSLSATSENVGGQGENGWKKMRSDSAGESKCLTAGHLKTVVVDLHDHGRHVSSNSVSDTDRILTAIMKLQERFAADLNALEVKLTDTILQTMRAEIDVVKKDFTTRIEDVVSRVTTLESTEHTCGEKRETDISLNIVVRNLAEGRDENVLNKVNGLIKDGLKLRDVSVDEATRKNPGRGGRAGLIVARCRSAKDKEDIMKAKRKLSDSRNFKDVSINHDKSHEQQIQDFNWNTIVSVVGKDKVTMRGSRVVFKNNTTPGGGRQSQRKQGEDMSVSSRHGNSGRAGQGGRLSFDTRSHGDGNGHRESSREYRGRSMPPCITQHGPRARDSSINNSGGEDWVVFTNRNKRDNGRRNGSYNSNPTADYK